MLPAPTQKQLSGLIGAREKKGLRRDKVKRYQISIAINLRYLMIFFVRTFKR